MDLIAYKQLLGKQIIEFLSGNISFDELENNISDFKSEELSDNDQIKKVWHAIYQIKMDMEIQDKQYVDRLIQLLREVAESLIANDDLLSKKLEKYYN